MNEKDIEKLLANSMVDDDMINGMYNDILEMGDNSDFLADCYSTVSSCKSGYTWDHSEGTYRICCSK